jgi:TonB-dependent receptor
VTFSEPVAVQESGSYDVFLPSANVKLDMQEDLIMRAAIGKSITRGTLGDLLLNTNYNVRERERNVTSGNPSLKPTIAWNYDLTLSWYIDDISYLSGSVFYKDLKDKAERETNTIQILGFDFLSNRPENKAEGEVAGFELSGQYAFENGFGVKLNYTDTTNTSIDPSGPDFDLDAKSFNIVGFYDKGSLQARLAYSFRDEYLESRAANRGQPRTFASYGQWDASASYEFSENFLFFVEGTNLTNERTRQFSKFSERLIELKDTGRRFAVGMRMSF